jgi:hypothetical protein
MKEGKKIRNKSVEQITSPADLFYAVELSMQERKGIFSSTIIS